jgi:hypothetical protein
MSDSAPAPDRVPATTGPAVETDDVSDRNRLALTEDWAATIVGLLILALVLSGIITKGLVP